VMQHEGDRERSDACPRSKACLRATTETGSDAFTHDKPRHNQPGNRAYQYHVMSGRAALKPIKSPVWNAGSDGAKWQWKQAPRRAPKRTLPRDATEETPIFDRRDVSRRPWCASMSISRASRRAEPKFRLGRSITSPFEVRRPPLKAAVTFLGVNGWKRQWQNRIMGHGGRGLRG
jgi:hypothetical protein